MRKDFDKVVVERPRRGHTMKYRNARHSGQGAPLPRGKYNKNDEDWEDHRPTKESMTFAHLLSTHGEIKEFSDLIGPLRRYLLSKVGQPWNKVWSEICQVMKGRGVSAEHIKGHIRSDVGGIPHPGHKYFRADDWHNPYDGIVYVDAHGIVRKSKQRIFRRPVKKYDHVSESSEVEYHRLNGAWFKVEITEGLPIPEASRFTSRIYYRKYYYVKSKRALSRKEVKRLDLENRLATKASLIGSLEEYLKLGSPAWRV